MCSLKKSPIAFGKDGIKSHSPPANAHCCRSFFHVWSQAYISKTNNLVSFLTVIHNANKTACERACNPKRRLTARRGRKKEEKKETNSLDCLPPASLISIFLLFLRLPLSLFSDCFSILFLLQTHTPEVEWHTCHCCYNSSRFVSALLLSFSILTVATGGPGSSEQESVASLFEIITSSHPTERCNIKPSLWIPIQPDSRHKRWVLGEGVVGF